MSAMDNIDKPGDSSPAQTEAAETETLQAFADASTPNQSDSHPDLNEALDTVDGLESLRASGGLNKKRKTTSQCQICSCNLKNEKPYYQVRAVCKCDGAHLIIQSCSTSSLDFHAKSDRSRRSHA